ncbi:Glucose dehydrogenase [FAD, quinone], partial [Araneus ventricosus]
GPLTVMKPRYTAEVKGPLEEAAEELGYEIVDSNGAYQTGKYTKLFSLYDHVFL